jgi:2-(1,2-epoxy-1,2-dihydrophenyl)acetyl-CoA isomerase
MAIIPPAPPSNEPQLILTEMRGNALIITFNRPEHGNTMTEVMANQLFKALKSVATNPAIRAVMLRGAGGNFMNGIDLEIYHKNIEAGVQKKNEVMLPYHSVIRELHAMDKPVLAVMTGMTLKSGFSFMLVSDLVLAARSARFKAGYASLAMTPDGGVSFFLTRKVGVSKAAEILMLNEEFDAETAEKWHLVNAVVDDELLEQKAMEWLDTLANGPTKALGGIKRLIAKAFEQDMNTHIGFEHTYWGASSRSFDFKNAIRSHFEGKPAKFTGG